MSSRWRLYAQTSPVWLLIKYRGQCMLATHSTDDVRRQRQRLQSRPVNGHKKHNCHTCISNPSGRRCFHWGGQNQAATRSMHINRSIVSRSIHDYQNVSSRRFFNHLALSCCHCSEINRKVYISIQWDLCTRDQFVSSSSSLWPMMMMMICRWSFRTLTWDGNVFNHAGNAVDDMIAATYS